MAGKGAPKGNRYASKGAGVSTSIYIDRKTINAIAEQRKARGENASDDACVEQARAFASAGIEEHISPTPELDQLRFMVSNWQALSNHAEVFAPELRDNPQWIAMKVDLERRNDAIGITDFIRQVGERYRERIEAEDDENEDL